MKRCKRKYEVSIGNQSTIVHVESESEAIDRAVVKMFGSRCFWFPNHGVPGYGQVFEALRPTKYNSNPGNSSQTSMIGIDAEAIGRPSKKFIAQQKQDETGKAEAGAAARAFQEELYSAYIDGRTGNPMPTERWLQADWRDGVIDQRHEEEKTVAEY